MRKFAFLSYFSREFMNYLFLKKSQILPCGRSWAQDKSSRAARSEVFKEKIQNCGRRFTLDVTDLSVAGEEGHSTILLSHYVFWSKMFRNLTFVVQFAYFSIRPKNVFFFPSNFEQLS